MNWLRNTPINIEFYRNSSLINEEVFVNVIRDDVLNILLSNNISSNEYGGDILINEYTYGSMKMNGLVAFTYSSFEKQIINGVSLHFTFQGNYNSLSDDIFGLVNAVKNIENKIYHLIPNDVSFMDMLRVKLKNVRFSSSIINIIKYSNNEAYNYLYLSNGMNIELSSNEIILSKQIDAAGIKLLKDIVAVYY